MKSIDNLRDYVLTAPSVCSTTRDILVGYIDDIDREVAEVRDRDYRNGREDAKGAAEFADRLCRAAERREDVTLWAWTTRRCPWTPTARQSTSGT